MREYGIISHTTIKPLGDRKMANCSNCGSPNISFKRENVGEVRGKRAKQVVHRTVGFCRDCGYTWVSSTDSVNYKKKNTWLWVLGWLFIFPLPLTILLLRKKNMNSIVKYVIIGIAWLFYLLIVTSGKTGDKTDATTPTTPATTQSQEIEDSPNEALAKTDNAKQPDDLKEQFSKEIGDGTILFDTSVRNDTTGRWRLMRIASSKNILDYAVDYYKAYFESDDEIHFVVNFSLNTTTVIARYADYLDITIHEYVKGEEHDAKILGGGDVLKEYWVYIDSGEIVDLSNAE